MDADADKPVLGYQNTLGTAEDVASSLPRADTTEPQPTRQQKPNYKVQYILSGHTMSISSLKFSPDGSVLASSGVFTFSQIHVLSSLLFSLGRGRKPRTSS